MQMVQTSPSAPSAMPRRAVVGSAAGLPDPGVQGIFCAMTFLAAELKTTVPRDSSDERVVAESVTL